MSYETTLVEVTVEVATITLERASIAAMASPAERAQEQERAAASQAAYGKIFQR